MLSELLLSLLLVSMDRTTPFLVSWMKSSSPLMTVGAQDHREHRADVGRVKDGCTRDRLFQWTGCGARSTRLESRWIPARYEDDRFENLDVGGGR